MVADQGLVVTPWAYADWGLPAAAAVATLTVRGTSEIYSGVEALPEVHDSLVVDPKYLGRESDMPLFVVLRPGSVLHDALRARINGAVRTALSPRFVPDDIFVVAEVPRTLSGKKQELPVKKPLLGQPIMDPLRHGIAPAPCAPARPVLPHTAPGRQFSTAWLHTLIAWRCWSGP